MIWRPSLTATTSIRESFWAPTGTGIGTNPSLSVQVNPIFYNPFDVLVEGERLTPADATEMSPSPPFALG
jgi:hypothetical protein